MRLLTEKNDSYREEEKLIDPFIKPIYFNFAGKEAFKSDLNKIYKRVGDLNKLQTKYLTNKDNHLHNNEFNQIYYKLKKKK